jgi:hypothetical protein
MHVKFRIHDSNKLLQGAQLSFHSALISEEIRFLPVSQINQKDLPSSS